MTEITHTPRGFASTHHTTCDYGSIVRVWESSAVERHVWLAVQQPVDINTAVVDLRNGREHTGEYHRASAHLLPDQAVEVVTKLTTMLSEIMGTDFTDKMLKELSS